MAQKPGMDLILQATGGIMAHTGEEGGPPIKSAPPVADLNTGVYAAYAILGALFARERSGEGQHVHVAMLDAVLSLFADNAVNVLIEGTRFGRFGSGHPDLVPYQAFPASDGYFIVACLTNAFFKRLCVALGREDWLNDPALSPPTRPASRAAPRSSASSARSSSRTPASTGSRCSSSTTSRAARSWRCTRFSPTRRSPRTASSTATKIPCAARSPPSARRCACRRRRPCTTRVAPMLGEHTDEVLREFGLSDGEIDGLRAANVIN